MKTEQVQYYHRAVGCQIVSSPCQPFLDLEWRQPGEGEDTAALRLLNRLPELDGSRLFDILLLDALYAQAPVLQLAQATGWKLVVSLTQNHRDLYQSAVRLFAQRPADASGTERRAGKRYEFLLWATDGLPFSADHPEPVGVVRSEETLTQNHYRHREIQPETTPHEWLWITTLAAQAFPATIVRQLGHARWKQENNGCNDLTLYWAFKHGFLHAGLARAVGIGGPAVAALGVQKLLPQHPGTRRARSPVSFLITGLLACLAWAGTYPHCLHAARAPFNRRPGCGGTDSKAQKSGLRICPVPFQSPFANIFGAAAT